MKRTMMMAAALVLAGCALTPTQKKILIGTGTVLAIGAIHAASRHDHDDDPARIGAPGDPCTPNPQACR